MNNPPASVSTERSLSPLEKAQQAMAERRAAGIAIERLDPIEKARRNPKSLRLAINGKCWDCIGAGADPHPRAAIRDYRLHLAPGAPLPSQRRRRGGRAMNSIANSIQSDSLTLPIRLLEYVNEALVPDPSPNCPDMLVSATDLLHIHNLLEMAIDELHRLQDQAVNGEAQT